MLKRTSINSALLLEDHFFSPQFPNIDDLVKQACNDPSNSLELLNKAISACEKFHSYFHYEESFFFLKLAESLIANHEPNKVIKAYQTAIFQDHLNARAHLGLIKYYQSLGLFEEADTAKSYAHSLKVTLDNNYSRPFDAFSDYIKWATGYTAAEPPLPCNSFWASFSMFLESDNQSALQAAIDQVKSCHKSYHHNSALIYLNLAIKHEVRGNIDLAKNAKVKAINLDPSIKY